MKSNIQCKDRHLLVANQHAKSKFHGFHGFRLEQPVRSAEVADLVQARTVFQVADLVQARTAFQAEARAHLECVAQTWSVHRLVW